jgi:hypothetical protein
MEAYEQVLGATELAAELRYTTQIYNTILRSWQGCTRSTSLEEVHAHHNKAGKYHCVNWFVRD